MPPIQVRVCSAGRVSVRTPAPLTDSQLCRLGTSLSAAIKQVNQIISKRLSLSSVSGALAFALMAFARHTHA